jgi:dihydroorotate dehydrogenase
LASHGIAHPTYNYFKEFADDVRDQGPWDSVPGTWVASTPPIWRLLGYDVSFPVGVPASVLTATSDWIEYYARRGFNVLTYKTVRSEQRYAHPAPNWVFLKNLREPLLPGQPLPESTHGDTLSWPHDPNAFSMANSFGVPSFAPEVWQKDVSKAVACLRSGQVLIVSVMGTWEDFKGSELIKDFVNVARMAKDARAPAIELNLSCPNTLDPETGKVKQNLICESAKDTAEIVQAVRNVIGDTPLVIKLAYMPRERLEEVVVPLVEASLIQAVSGINTVQMTVRGDDDSPAFPGTAANPQARLKAGVSGVAIRNYGLQFVRWLNEIREQHALEFDIIGMGGVMNPGDVDDYLKAGAQAVQTATAAFFNPDLPKQIYEKFGGVPVPEAQLDARDAVLELLANQGPKPLREIAAEVAKLFPADRILLENTQAILSELENRGLVTWERQRGKSVFRLEQRAEEQLEPTL